MTRTCGACVAGPPRVGSTFLRASAMVAAAWSSEAAEAWSTGAVSGAGRGKGLRVRVKGWTEPRNGR